MAIQWVETGSIGRRTPREFNQILHRRINCVGNPMNQIGSSNQSIFISYSSADEDVVHPLGKLLKASGSAPFIDTNDLEFAKSWSDQIDDAIRRSGSMMVFWSRNASSSVQVEREWRLALNLQKPIVPVLMCKDPPLPEELGQFHGVRLFQMFDAISGTLFQSELTHRQHLSQDFLQGIAVALRNSNDEFETAIKPSLQQLYSNKDALEQYGLSLWSSLSGNHIS
jgi:hypothetical protein